ncbi:MAG TPA: hypothetical protein VJU82_03605, partial [Acidobacteriaceae bacterium]|nr:hypothetical protein [Acidobacteriaceae bacterium]
MKNLLEQAVVSLFVPLALAVLPVTAHAQGCVAAHSPQPVIAGLDPTSEQSRRSFSSGGLLHGLTVTTSFRTYSSFRHYIGTVYQEQRAIKQNALLNHV